VTIRDEKTMRIWDATTREPLTPEFSQGGIATSAAFSPDGTRLTTYGEKVVRIWDAATGVPTIPPIMHNGNVVVVDFSSDSSRLATACDDGIARVWDVSTGDPVTRPLVHAAPVRMLVIAADGKRVASGAQDGTARIWDARTGEALTPKLKHDEDFLGEVAMLAFHRMGRSWPRREAIAQRESGTSRQVKPLLPQCGTKRESTTCYFRRRYTSGHRKHGRKRSSLGGS